MKRAKASAPPSSAQAVRGRLGEVFLLVVLTLMVVVMGYMRFVVMEASPEDQAPEFVFKNPLLAAQPGERVLFYDRDRPQRLSCLIVRPEAVQMRASHGPERMGVFDGLRRERAYLATEYKGLNQGEQTCAAASQPAQTILYALNNFGMPHDSQVRVHSMQPLRVKWRDREIVVYEVVFERYGMLSGTWMTYLSEDAPAVGLVKRTALHASRPPEEVHFQELVEPQ